MRARSGLTVDAPPAPGGPSRLTRMVSAPPVAWRPTPVGVYLVGTAASPVGDDDIDVDIEVRAGAALTLRSAAATVLWSSRGTTGSRQRFRVTVAAGARLDWAPEPLIATGGCHHVQHVRMDLAGTATLRWEEVVVLGRYGEQPGRLELRVDVDVDHRPLLRHQLTIGPDQPGWDGPAVLADRRVIATVISVGAAHQPRPGAGRGWATMTLDGPGTLTLATGADLPAVRRSLQEAAAAADEAPGRAGPYHRSNV